jgi:hypothetical protein
MIQNTKQPQQQKQESPNSKTLDETTSELTTSERDSVKQQRIQVIDDSFDNPTQDQTTEICFQKVEDNCRKLLIMTFVMDDSGGDLFAGGDPLKGFNVAKPGADPCPPPPPRGSQQGNTIIDPFKC